MITAEQLADALARLDPRDREVLDLSLRRRVPDEALAEVFDWQPSEVARHRAAAIERLADDLGVQRGEELGAVLRALLEPDTWSALDARAAERASDDASAEAAAVPVAEAARREARSAPGPVLEMLGAPSRRPARRGSLRAALAVGAGVLALAGVAGLAGATLFDDGGGGGGSTAEATRHFTPQAAGPVAAPFASDPKAVVGYLTATIKRPVFLYAEPGGPKLIRIDPRTEWNSPRVMAVVRRSGRWLAVLTSELANGRVGWLPISQTQLGSVDWSLHADLSRRKLYVRRNGHTVRRFRVAIGSIGHPTPLGRFAVTDRLRVEDKSSPYGCCVLALTGHQTRLPDDWPGGDRLAVHATTDLRTIGKRVSLGCMRVLAGDARWLIRAVPLGTPMFVHS